LIKKEKWKTGRQHRPQPITGLLTRRP
jgi:hypothetical protein